MQGAHRFFRPRRRPWRHGVAAVLVVLCLVIGLMGPWPATQTPALQRRGGSEALTAAMDLGQELVWEPSRAAPLLAGWARRDFQLEAWPLAGYGERCGAASTGQAEPLQARCVLLRAGQGAVLLVFADLLYIYPELAVQVETGLARLFGASQPPWPVFFTATHTHCGPGGWGRNPVERSVTGPWSQEVTERLAESICAAAHEAAASLQPVTWGWLMQDAPQGLRNRTLPKGIVDPSLETLVLRREKDGQFALLTLFGAHATCLSAATLEFSADYPGVLVRVLEEAGHVDFAAFAAGVVGSHAPVGVGDEWRRAEHLGRSLAARILPALDKMTWRHQAHLRAASAPMSLPALQLRLGRHLQLARPAARWLHPGSTRLAALALDEHIWLGLPVELSGMLSPTMRSHARQLGWRLHLSCFNGDYLGYVLPDDLHADLSLYEARMNFLGPGGGTFLTRVVNSVLQAAAKTAPPALE